MKVRSFRTSRSKKTEEPEWVELGGPRIAKNRKPGTAGVRGEPEIFVMEDGFSRCLHFGPEYVQSRMNLDSPEELHFGYTQKMMAFLLFCPQPRHVLIVGLGGGSLTKFCYRHLPNARITSVEISARVIALARSNFGVPPPDERMSIVHADAVDFLASTKDRADVILLDGCDEQGVDPAFCNERFYRCVRDALKHRGVVVANLVGTLETKRAHAALIAEVFDGHTVTLNVSNESNRIAFAFKDSWSAPDWSSMERKARGLSRKYGLDFPAFVRELQRDYQQPGEADT